MFEDKRTVRALRKIPYPALLLATAVICYLLAKLGLRFTYDESKISPVWPVAGFALAATLMLGYRIWPGIAAGISVASTLSFIAGGYSTPAIILAVLLVTVGNTLPPVLGAFLLRRFIKEKNPFDRVTNLVQYVFITGILITAIGATVGVAGINLAGMSAWSDFGSHWLYWWLGSMSGNLVIAPLLLVWIAGSKIDRGPRKIGEAVASLAVFIAISAVLFFPSREPGESSLLLSALIFPFLFSFIWAAVRFGHRGALTSTAIFGFMYTIAIMRGLPSQREIPQNETLLLAQLFLSTLAVATLFASAMTKERQESQKRILVAKDDLERANVDLKQEIAERKRTQLELERSNAELQQFAYVASHDLQEPLRMVASYVALLEESYGDKLGDDAHEFIGFAVEGANRMQKLIADLLAYSRVATLDKKFEKCDFGSALDLALADLKITIEENQAEITHDPLPEMPADCTRITQVWQNLISNAIRFRSQEPPRIHVTAGKKDGLWQFSVSDNGIGIDPKYFDRVFVIFQRLGKRRDYSGTGIGLALCKRIVEHHGGEIWVESEPGKGSTFYFTIQEA